VTFNFILIIIGLVLGTLAALIAFLVTYGEYSRHFMTKGKALKISLETALFIFILFAVIAVVTGFAFPKILGSS